MVEPTQIRIAAFLRVVGGLIMCLAYAISHGQDLPVLEFSHIPFDTDYKAWKGSRAVLQDNDGFVWVGTDEGLYRYDGREMRGYFESYDTDILEQ